jgi:hypothetical protein
MRLQTTTLCSDASYSPKYKIATWAVYIRTPKQTIQTSGVFKDTIKTKVTNSFWAESMGLANGLFIADKATDLTKQKLIVYCDNIQALTELPINVTPASKHYSYRKLRNSFYKKHIKAILEKTLKHETRHVKGHLKKEDWDKNSKRNFMNDWCDREAKRLLRNAVKARRLSDEHANNN